MCCYSKCPHLAWTVGDGGAPVLGTLDQAGTFPKVVQETYRKLSIVGRQIEKLWFLMQGMQEIAQ